MSLNYFDLKLAKLIQEKGVLQFQEFHSQFHLSKKSFIRYIQNLNQYLPSQHQYLITTNAVHSQMTYNELSTFIQSVTFKEYHPEIFERIQLILFYGFYQPIVSLSKLYQDIQLSLSTKKTDTKPLKKHLINHHLNFYHISTKGISIKGDEFMYRKLIVEMVSRTLEINENDELILRKLNTPVQKMIAQSFIQNTHTDIQFIKSKILTLDEYPSLSYQSKRFIYIYLLVSSFRIKTQNSYKSSIQPKIKCENISFFNHQHEDRYFSVLFASLDMNTFTLKNSDKQLQITVNQFIDETLNQMITKIYTKKELSLQVTQYIQKCILSYQLRSEFHDTKLDETHIHIKNMHRILENTIHIIEQKYEFTFTKSQLAGLTLIFRTHGLKNKAYARNTKRVVIVTNSTIEKTNYFVTSLSQLIDITLVASIHIAQLNKMKRLQFDYIIVFSNRIENILNQLKIPCINIHFYITHQEIEALINLGFSTSNRKLIASHFVKEIKDIQEDNLEEYLKQHYSTFFL